MTACTITKILERTDDRTGLTAEDFPTSLSTGNVGLVEMILLKPICIETFFDYPSLGRIILRDLKQTIAVGVVVKVTKSNLKDMKSLLETQNHEKEADEKGKMDEIDTTEKYDSLKLFSNNIQSEDSIDGKLREGKICNIDKAVTDINGEEGCSQEAAKDRPIHEATSGCEEKTHTNDAVKSACEEADTDSPVNIAADTDSPVNIAADDSQCAPKSNEERALKLSIDLSGTMNSTDEHCLEEDV